MSGSTKKYGSKGQAWHPKFVEYMEQICTHKSFQGLPDAIVDDGRIQWEAPSNRGSGRYKDTHHKRREWWIAKAKSLGIDTTSSQWISRTAKAIHPFGEKPCKRCGTVMSLRYVYPTKAFLRRISTINLALDPPPSQTEDIFSFLERLEKQYGERALSYLPKIFPAADKFKDLKDWRAWLLSTVPTEPRFLSPGAMSNAPDRFDGFHSFNLCCRSKADTGRHEDNLRLYSTDRRVFEYWADGDWIAADRLMGEVRARFRDEPCANGHPGPCDADHVGPLSLGFSHYPLFRLLCSACNSAKNNRMTLGDVKLLRNVERQGGSVMSWHSQSLWDLRKESVVTDETALRLSKLLRDNRHVVMLLLREIARWRHFAFLLSLLHLDFANFDVKFKNLRIEDSVTTYEGIIRTKRETKYAVEQKARRCRIASGELEGYFTKENRSIYVVWNDTVEERLKLALGKLNKKSKEIGDLNIKLSSILEGPPEQQDALLRDAVNEMSQLGEQISFQEAKAALESVMTEVAQLLSAKWTDERYVRPDWS
jgi:Alw26I/Eco31I/Esp3I family type II restriction endonuclease